MNSILTDKFYLSQKEGQWPAIFTGIYCIYSVKTNRKYIGKTKSIEGFKGRWADHRNLLRRNKHSNPFLQAHYNKYGESDIALFIVEICQQNISDMELNNKEREYIKSMKTMYSENGFNIETLEKLKRYQENYKSKTNKNKKIFKLINPFGKIIVIVGLKKFARDNQLKSSNIYKLLKGEKSSYKGYRSTNKSFHPKIVARNLPMLVRRWRNGYQYRFTIKHVTYTKSSPSLNVCIQNLETKLIELNATELFNKFTVSKNLYLNSQ